jgi:SAM-dependent methyltransferase
MPPRERTPEGVRDFAEAMWASANILGPDVAAALDLTKVRRALDVGGGTGRVAVALCSAAPDLRVTVFVPGDYLSGDLGSGFDLVLLSNVLHQERAEAAAAMVRRAAATLVPGGRLAIVDFTIDDHQRQVESGCLFAVNMRSFGDTWPEPVLRRWMRDAGLIEVTRADLGPTRWLMEGRRA